MMPSTDTFLHSNSNKLTKAGQLGRWRASDEGEMAFGAVVEPTPLADRPLVVDMCISRWAGTVSNFTRNGWHHLA